jgi:hypothetical protein
MADVLRRRGRNPEHAEAAVSTRNYDEWTIERWKAEPEFPRLEFDDPSPVDQAPPLWKDLTLASVVALALWVIAAVIFR